jgi:hypothetical protein
LYLPFETDARKITGLPSGDPAVAGEIRERLVRSDAALWDAVVKGLRAGLDGLSPAEFPVARPAQSGSDLATRE